MCTPVSLWPGTVEHLRSLHVNKCAVCSNSLHTCGFCRLTWQLASLAAQKRPCSPQPACSAWPLPDPRRFGTLTAPGASGLSAQRCRPAYTTAKSLSAASSLDRAPLLRVLCLQILKGAFSCTAACHEHRLQTMTLVEEADHVDSVTSGSASCCRYCESSSTVHGPSQKQQVLVHPCGCQARNSKHLLLLEIQTVKISWSGHAMQPLNVRAAA